MVFAKLAYLSVFEHPEGLAGVVFLGICFLKWRPLKEWVAGPEAGKRGLREKEGIWVKKKRCKRNF